MEQQMEITDKPEQQEASPKARQTHYRYHVVHLAQLIALEHFNVLVEGKDPGPLGERIDDRWMGKIQKWTDGRASFESKRAGILTVAKVQYCSLLLASPGLHNRHNEWNFKRGWTDKLLTIADLESLNYEIVNKITHADI